MSGPASPTDLLLEAFGAGLALGGLIPFAHTFAFLVALRTVFFAVARFIVLLRAPFFAIDFASQHPSIAGKLSPLRWISGMVSMLRMTFHALTVRIILVVASSGLPSSFAIRIFSRSAITGFVL